MTFRIERCSYQVEINCACVSTVVRSSEIPRKGCESIVLVANLQALLVPEMEQVNHVSGRS